MNKGEEKAQSFRSQAFGMVIFLLVEFIFGMYTTLYVHFPEKASVKESWMFSSKQMILNIHMMLGLLIVIGALVFFISAIVAKQSLWIVSTTVAIIGILLAVLGGVVFIPTQTDLYSFLMSIGFTLSVAAYGWGLYLDKMIAK